MRRRIYLCVRSQRRPVTREDVSSGVAVSRKLAAFHLDKLVERGLLVARYGRPGGRGGPGSGRPPKLYEVASVSLAVSIPERRYDLVAGVLARAVAGSGGRVRAGVLDVARDEGRRAAQKGGRRGQAAVRAVLDELGFETGVSGGDVVLANCPFAATARQAPGVVCALNQAFNEGVLEGFGGHDLEAVAAPAPDRCCVVLRRRR